MFKLVLKRQWAAPFPGVSSERGLGRLDFNVALENFKQRKETKSLLFQRKHLVKTAAP